MTEENTVNAITGETSVVAAKEVVDWESKYNHQAEVLAAQNGRVKASDARVKELEKEIAELRAAKRTEELESSLTEDERAGIPDDILKAAAKLVNSGMGRMQAENERRFQEMESLRNAESEHQRKIAEQGFVARIDAQYPKFRSSIGPGGDKADAWASYLKYNRGSVKAAYDSSDFDTLSYHIGKFYRDHLGIPVPSAGQDGSAASDPETHGGGANPASGLVPGKVYTSAEYVELYDKVEEARSRGDYAEKRRLEAEIKNAPNEGRVKDS